jgi:predicted sulfurtransferase
MSRKNQKQIETATPVVNIETPAVAEAPVAEAPKASSLTIVTTERKPLTVIAGTKNQTETQADPIPAEVLAELAELKLNTVNSVKTLHASGYSRKQIVAAGYNSSTVYRQVGEYIKAKAIAEKLSEETAAAAPVTEEVTI